MAKDSGWKEVQKRNKLIKATLQRAKEAQAAHDSQTALQLFEQCLQASSDSDSAIKQDQLEACRGLADSSFAIKDYARAEQAYNHCLELIGQEPGNIELIISLMFKRARALEGLKDLEPTGKLLLAAVKLAGENLPAGHLLISSTLEARAAFLRKYRQEGELADQLSEAAQANIAFKAGGERGLYDQLILGSLAHSKTEENQGLRRHSTPKTGQGRRKFLQGESDWGSYPVGKQIARLTAVTGCLVAAGLAMAALTTDWGLQRATSEKAEKTRESADEISLIGKTYETADNLEALTFMSGNKAKITIGGSSKTVTFSCTENIDRGQSSRQFALHMLSPTSLADSAGNILYCQGAPEKILIDQAKFMASALNSYLVMKRHYPTDQFDIHRFEPGTTFASPYEKHDYQPLIFCISDSRTFQDYLQAATENKLWKGFQPSAMEVLILNDGEDRSFIIRIRDRNNQLLTSSIAGKVFVLSSHNGDDQAFQGILAADNDYNDLNESIKDNIEIETTKN